MTKNFSKTFWIFPIHYWETLFYFIFLFLFLFFFVFFFIYFQNKYSTDLCLISYGWLVGSADWWVIIWVWTCLWFVSHLQFELEEIKFCPQPHLLDSKFTWNQLSGFSLSQHHTSLELNSDSLDHLLILSFKELSVGHHFSNINFHFLFIQFLSILLIWFFLCTGL